METKTEETDAFLSFFEHADEISKTVDSVVAGASDSAAKISRFKTVLAFYQEQSELLDPHLESIITPLTTALFQRARNYDSNSEESVRNFCSLLQCVTKVRGHKSVVKFYPVEVNCFIPVLNLLQCFENAKGDGAWETQCQLMLWLSALSLIPFDLQTLDDETHGSVLDRIQKLAKSFLRDAGTVREFACLLIYRLLTRPDMNKTLMSFMENALEQLKKMDEEEDVFQIIGATQAASFIFKHGERMTLLPVAQQYWKTTYEMMHCKTIESSLLLRKLAIKLVQRLALTLLEPITPKWRYIQTTVHANKSSLDPNADKNNRKGEDNDEEYEIPEEIEEVIELLLSGVADKDTNVRWSSAKGIGRVCSRLPKSLANEVLSYTLDLFSDTADDSSWHGACLSVAELARRGLLLPESIPTLVPFVEKALLYDVNRGAYSIGAHVRDSACYVCWACARSFDAEIMAPFMPTLAPVLMTTACLDREVNCRRAAAAAFQECVGRIGNLPNGLEVVQVADYFSLSKRSQAYLVVAPTIAEFPTYTHALISHLFFEKVGHWDAQLRELTAEALGCLAKFDLEYFTCDALDTLLAWALNNNLDQRHGACLSLASVMRTLIDEDVEIPEDRLSGIANIVMKIEKNRLYRGKGGSIMRQAVSKIIESIASSHLTRSEKHRLRLLSTINENIGHPKQEVTPDAIKALYFLSREFKEEEIEEATKAMTRFYLHQLKSENVAFRRGYTLAVGQLPKFLLEPYAQECMDALCESTKIEDKVEDRDAQSRANAVKSLTKVFCELYSRTHPSKDGCHDIYLKIMETLFSAMEDYSVDRRGDVGSWIREAAMEGLARLLVLFKDSIPSLDALTLRVVSYLIRNSVERISSIRQTAIKHLMQLMEHSELNILHKDALLKIKAIDEDVLASFGTTKGVEAMVVFLKFEDYQSPLLEGLIASIGGLEKALSDAVCIKLVQVLVEMDSENSMKGFLDCLLAICSKYNKSKRMATPVLLTIDTILKEHSLFVKMPDEFLRKVIKLVRSSLNGTKDFGRLSTGASVLSCLIFQSAHSDNAWKELLFLVGNQYPIVRKQTAEIMYERVLFQEDTPQISALSQLLLETAWDGSIKEVIVSQSKIAQILRVEVPIREKKTTKGTDGAAKATMIDENASYRALVDDVARGM